MGRERLDAQGIRLSTTRQDEKHSSAQRERRKELEEEE